MFFTDTCFWIHAKTLSDEKIFDFRELQSIFEFGITHQIKKEYEIYLSDYLSIDTFLIKPVSEQEIYSMKKINPFLPYLDIADQSLFTIGKLYGKEILTDDRDLLNQCLAYKIESFTISEFTLVLVINDILEKKTAHQIWTGLLKNKILPKDKYKLLWKQLEKIT